MRDSRCRLRHGERHALRALAQSRRRPPFARRKGLLQSRVEPCIGAPDSLTERSANGAARTGSSPTSARMDAHLARLQDSSAGGAHSTLSARGRGSTVTVIVPYEWFGTSSVRYSFPTWVPPKAIMSEWRLTAMPNV